VLPSGDTRDLAPDPGCLARPRPGERWVCSRPRLLHRRSSAPRPSSGGRAVALREMGAR